jgi:DNA repair protein RecO
MSPYSGGIELLTRANIGVIVRPNSELALITEWDLQETFPQLRRSLRAHYAAMYIAELVHHSVHGHDPHAALYEALLESLRALGHEPGSTGVDANIDAALLRFQWMVLKETGYQPILEVPGGSESTGAYLRFSPSKGALVHAGENDTEGTWRVRRETIRTLQRFADGPDESGEASADSQAGAGNPVQGESQSLHRANCLLAAYLRHVLGREARTLTLLFGKRLPS